MRKEHSMTVHRFQPTEYYLTFGPHEPVLRIADGDTLFTTTADAAGYDARGEQVAGRGNPLTGPFYVENAEPGDTLAVKLEYLYPNRASGYTAVALAPNVVDPAYARFLPERGHADWRIDLEAGTATLMGPATRLGELRLPLSPMLGCLGVAPRKRQSLSTATSAEHGGNMDYRGLVAGVTVYLPVFEPGALLFVGDGHAVQGDGEIVGTGVEVSFDVRLSVRLLKGKSIGWPCGENDDYIFTMGNARPLDQALQHATTEMLRWLQEDRGLDPLGAQILLGQCVEYEVGNVYDPAFTMVCKLPKRVLALLE
jgi:acetamidase/formamidase